MKKIENILKILPIALLTAAFVASCGSDGTSSPDLGPVATNPSAPSTPTTSGIPDGSATPTPSPTATTGGTDQGAVALKATLNGASEAPPVTTSATGSSTIDINADRTEIRYTLNVSGLNNVTGAHIHIGAVGVSGPIILPISTTPNVLSTSGTLRASNFTPQPAQGINTFVDAVNAIIRGDTYLNVHTNAYPNGEIRGQIVR